MTSCWKVGLCHLLLLALFAKETSGRWLDHHSWIHRGVSLQSKVCLRNTHDPVRIQNSFHDLRGGDEDGDDDDDDDDEERYSRQVYTLGARAHGLVRKATVFVDGPPTSGLTYETVKNLALSGIGRIAIVTSEDSSHDRHYHHSKLDDLGNMYVRGARNEIGINEKIEQDANASYDLLIEYLRRLNPSLQVEKLSRSELQSSKKNGEREGGILLCVDRPFDTQVVLNSVCRTHSLSFVAVETAGVYGRIFSDFGPTFEVHDVDGETPAIVPIDKIEVSSDNHTVLLIRAIEGERHDVSKGDAIRFQKSDGEVIENTFTVLKVLTPEKILVTQDSTNDNDEFDLDELAKELNEEASSFSRQKELTLMSFSSLEEVTQNNIPDPSIFTPCDFEKAFEDSRRTAIFQCFQELNDFVKNEHCLPISDGISTFLRSTNERSSSEAPDENWTVHCRNFARNAAAKFVPIQCIFGAIAAQECLKAASGLYKPIHQFLMYDCDEVLPNNEDCQDPNIHTMDTGLEYILGSTITSSFRSQKLFVVGAGAIGCEILKDLAAMNAGTVKNGVIVVTDMDTIEKSNLSRQLLFRDGDISKFKSKAAEEAMNRMNPSMKTKVYTSKVGDDGTGPFNSKFWSKKVHVVLNALDNMDARLFIDSKCVANQKALVDAGTLGSKGNVQVVVPHMSESYASSADPPDPSIPVCTLKNFPYMISHTIQWGRDLFDGMFVRRPTQANKYAELLKSGANNIEALLKNEVGDEAAQTIASELQEDMILQSAQIEDVRKGALLWAANQAYILYHDSIVKLLDEHPLTSLDEDGVPFWSGSRKPPKAMIFPKEASDELVDENLLAFVRCGARLRIESFFGTSSNSSVSEEDAKMALVSVAKTSSSTESEVMSTSSMRAENHKGTLKTLIPAEFEKDDETNDHVNFITAASNLRAVCYGIPPATSMETRRVAGRIVPAMITTTAFVSALSCVELLKLVQKAPLKRHRNAFINLALPFFAFTVPLPAEEVEGPRSQTYTLWDRINVKESRKDAQAGGITLRHLLRRLMKSIEDSETIEIASISYGEYMIYANFLNDDDDEILDMNLWDVVQDAVTSGNEFDTTFSREAVDGNSPTQLIDHEVLDLTVFVEDFETGDEIELPPVKVSRSQSK